MRQHFLLFSRLIRYSFYLEGIATVIVGCTVYFILPNSPRDAKWLTDAEAEIIERRLQEDAGTKDGQINNHDGFRLAALTRTLGDWKLWVWGIAVCGQSIPFYAFGFFAPTIIKGLGFKTWRAQLLTVPIYMVACVATIVVALWSDRRQNRWPFIFIPYCVAAVGFVALLAIPHPKLPGLTYGFLFLVPSGCKSSPTIFRFLLLTHFRSIIWSHRPSRLDRQQPRPIMASSNWHGLCALPCELGWRHWLQHLPRTRRAALLAGLRLLAGRANLCLVGDLVHESAFDKDQQAEGQAVSGGY